MAISGTFEESTAGGEKVRAFVPAPLPPDISAFLPVLLPKLLEAQHALGKLSSITELLPSPELFLYMYVRKEAVLSSQIEGTQSTLTDLLKHEAGETDLPFDDVVEVSHYVQALESAKENLKTLPLSLRLLKHIHKTLLQAGRGSTKNPGEFRRSQNWIGGTRPGNALFVPPPPHRLEECLFAWEKFIHETKTNLPPLLKAGLLHVQFETIHPFLDGNGRVGRLFIPLYLCETTLLKQPLLYLSLYFKQNRKDYYRLLQEVREHSAWLPWLEFFLEGIKITAEQAVQTAHKVRELFENDRQKIIVGVSNATNLLKIHQNLQQQPFTTIASAAERAKLSFPSANSAIKELQTLGILTETTGQARNRKFVYQHYIDLLKEGTENTQEPQDPSGETHSAEK